MNDRSHDPTNLPVPSTQDDADPGDTAPVEALAKSPRESAPPAWIEENLVATLRADGIIRGRKSGRRTVQLTPAWAMAAAVAALALFGAGFLVGDERGTERTLAAVEVVTGASATQQAYQVQRMGSLYVEALAGLVALDAGTDEEARRQGSMAARSILWAAAAELSRLDPDDADVQRVMAALGGNNNTNLGDGAVRSYLWF